MIEKPILFSAPMIRALLDGRKTMTRRVFKNAHIDCSLYKTGMRLWVRETFADTYALGDYPGHTIFKATYLHDLAGFNPPPETWLVKWKPSIFMPRCASRITLEITGVDFDWIQNITEEDVLREGIEDMGNGCGAIKLDTAKSYSTLKATFKILWDSINGKKYPWASNPWVWVISFKLVSQ